MRTLKVLLTGTAVAIAGMLAVMADPASAAASHARTKANPAAKVRAERCIGAYEAMENGVCVHTHFANPDRTPEDFTVYYRSTGKKHKEHKPRNS